MSHGAARVHTDAYSKTKRQRASVVVKPAKKEYSLYRYVNVRAIIVMPACDVVEI